MNKREKGSKGVSERAREQDGRNDCESKRKSVRRARERTIIREQEWKSVREEEITRGR
jgi:hypothetical protein